MPAIAYLVHDLNDAAVRRRVESLALGGADLTVAGFYRREPVTTVAGAPAFPLGRSKDGKLWIRALLVLRRLLRRGVLAHRSAKAQVLIARNLEMLVLAARLRRPDQKLVYECLDIHRLMLRNDPAGRLLRRVERMALARCDLVLTSSPAFIREYFVRLQHYGGPILLVENKVMKTAGEFPSPVIAPPWRIGWFGMIRCSKSLAILKTIVENSRGTIEVVIAGIPSPNEFPDFESAIADTPGIRFVGAYSPDDLPRLYGSVHFAWCIDFFEEGLNSDWLLPNRLYESIAQGAVPLALSGVESGRWLNEAGLGLLLDDAREAGAALQALTPEAFREMQEAVRAFPRERVAFAKEDHEQLVRQLGELAC